MFSSYPFDGHQEALLALQELSTVLRCLATEIETALSGDGDVDRERLGKIALALNSNRKTLLNLSDSTEVSGE
jgi:hypothetical protein